MAKGSGGTRGAKSGRTTTAAKAAAAAVGGVALEARKLQYQTTI